MSKRYQQIPQQMRPQQQRMEVSEDSVFSAYGRVVFENTILRARLAEAEMRLRELEPETPENGAAVSEMVAQEAAP